MSRPSRRYFELFAAIPGATFVETGLYKGGGVHSALMSGYQRIISIEPVREFIDECSKKYAKDIALGRIKLVHGGSEERLANVISDIDGPIVYWLDGHFQGEKEGGELNCPLGKELEAIICRKDRSLDVVLIDDLRLLRTQSAWQGHDVEIDRMIGRVIEAFPFHCTMYLDGFVENDVLAIVPSVLTGQVLNIRAIEVASQGLRA